MIEGWNREWAGAKDTCTPISPDILARLGEVRGMVCSDPFEACLFRAATVTSQALQKAGIRGWQFGTHSFHIVAASTVTALGYSVEQR